MAHLLKSDRESFLKLVKPYIEGVWEGLQKIRDPEIREHSFAFFYNIAYCLQDDFKPFIEPMMELIYQTIESKEGIKKKPTVGLSLDSDSESDDGGRFFPAGNQKIILALIIITCYFRIGCENGIH